MSRKRVYFIGSGPSIAMGVPSVEKLYSEIINRKHISNAPQFHSLIESIIPNFNPDKVNFEEILTLLDDDGIGSEIFKIPRGVGQEQTFAYDTEFPSFYKSLIKMASEIIYDEMGDIGQWLEYTQKFFPSNSDKQREVMEKKSEFWPIRNAWFDQYRKINQERQDILNNDFTGDKDADFVVTTNYDVLLEKNMLSRYCYTNPDVNKTLIVKLHGSINWFELTSDQFPEDKYFTESSWFEILSFKTTSRIISYPAMMSGDLVGSSLFATPIIVPPMAHKKYDQPLFRHMFWLASNFLSKADELVILGYKFSDYDFYVKKMIDFSINAKESKVKNIYHYDMDKAVLKKVEDMIRKKGLNLTSVEIDFSKEVPDFDNMGNKLKIARI